MKKYTFQKRLYLEIGQHISLFVNKCTTALYSSTRQSSKSQLFPNFVSKLVSPNYCITCAAANNRQSKMRASLVFKVAVPK